MHVIILWDYYFSPVFFPQQVAYIGFPLLVVALLAVMFIVVFIVVWRNRNGRVCCFEKCRVSLTSCHIWVASANTWLPVWDMPVYTPCSNEDVVYLFCRVMLWGGVRWQCMKHRLGKQWNHQEGGRGEELEGVHLGLCYYYQKVELKVPLASVNKVRLDIPEGMGISSIIVLFATVSCPTMAELH